MKKERKVVRFDYSKYESNISWDSELLKEHEFWGFHMKKGRLRIDTKRYKKACEQIGIKDFIPKGLFNQRNRVYFTPSRAKRSDYKINIFRDLIKELKNDWLYEFKPVFDMIKTPKEVEDESRLHDLAYISSADDYDDIIIESRIAGFKRISQYNKIINSLYCQFIMKITTEIDRFTLYVMTELGYKGSDFSTSSFFKFSDGLLKDKSAEKIEKLPMYDAYSMLHKINNFLKHNSIASYNTLKRFYPANVRSIEKGTSNIEYSNGMFAGDWIIIKDGYIDDVLNKIVIFFENYCSIYLKEDIEESHWNYDEYFIDAFNEMKYPFRYIGLPY